jgi:hypothetical protein
MSDGWVPRSWGGGLDPEAIQALRDRLEQRSDWTLVYEEQGVVVFRKERT